MGFDAPKGLWEAKVFLEENPRAVNLLVSRARNRGPEGKRGFHTFLGLTMRPRLPGMWVGS